jgi:hypothetical protein
MPDDFGHVELSDIVQASHECDLFPVPFTVYPFPMMKIVIGERCMSVSSHFDPSPNFAPSRPRIRFPSSFLPKRQSASFILRHSSGFSSELFHVWTVFQGFAMSHSAIADFNCHASLWHHAAVHNRDLRMEMTEETSIARVRGTESTNQTSMNSERSKMRSSPDVRKTSRRWTPCNKDHREFDSPAGGSSLFLTLCRWRDASGQPKGLSHHLVRSPPIARPKSGCTSRGH